MSYQPQSDQSGASQYLSFRLDNNLFAVEVTKVREILDLTPVTKVPKTPNHMLGVINLRGHVVPVVDLRRKFSIPAGEATRDSCIIVLEVVQEDELLTVGALADAVEEVMDLPPDQVEPPPRLGSGVDVRFIRGLGKKDERFFLLLDIDQIFATEDGNLLQQAIGETISAI